MSSDAGSLDALLHEDRRFTPSEAFRAHAVVNDAEVYARAAEDREAYWAGWADVWTGSSHGTLCSSGPRRTRSGFWEGS